MSDENLTREELSDKSLQELAEIKKKEDIDIEDYELICMLQREKTLEDNDSKFELNNENLKNLKFACAINSTQQEIAAAFGITRDTLRRHIVDTTGLTWQEFYNHYSAIGKQSVRSTIYRKAKEGVSAFSILWAKTHLEMNDEKPQETHIQISQKDIQQISDNLDDKY